MMPLDPTDRGSRVFAVVGAGSRLRVFRARVSGILEFFLRGFRLLGFRASA